MECEVLSICVFLGIYGLCIFSLQVGGVSYHDYHGIAAEDEKEMLARDLGDTNRVSVFWSGPHLCLRTCSLIISVYAYFLFFYMRASYCMFV